jgi:hypothetical protein
MTEVQILTKFKNQLLLFCNELIEQFPLESDFTVLRLFIENQIPIQKIIVGFHKQMNENDNKIRTMIAQRNENFFINEKPFSFISDEKKNKLGVMWTSGLMSDEDKEVMWQWVDLFIVLSDKYHEITNK